MALSTDAPSRRAIVATTIAGVVLCVIVFLLDVLSPLEAEVSILYLLAIAVGGYGRSALKVKLWTAACLTLATIAFVITHRHSMSADAIFRLVFSAIGMLVICALKLAMLRVLDSQSALARSQSTFRKFADLVPVGVWSRDVDTGATFMNQQCQELTGAAPEQVAQDWRICFHPEDIDRYEQLRHDSADNDAIHQTIARVGPPDRYRWTLLTRSRVRDEDSEQAGWIGAVMDIDPEIRAKKEIQRLNDELAALVEQRTLELSRSELRFSSLFSDLNIPCAEQEVAGACRLIRNAKERGFGNVTAWAAAEPDAVTRCKDALRFTMANAPLLTMVGCNDRDALLALPLSVWIEDVGRLLQAQITAMFEDHLHVAIAVTLIDKKGKRIPVALNLNILADWSSSFVTFTDISDQERAHEMVLTAQAELARAGRAATIGAISSSLIHELNQPILSVGLEAKNAMRWLDREPPDTAGARRALERLIVNVDRMSAIVRLTRERLIKRERSLGRVDLCALIGNSEALVERDLAARGATLIWQCLGTPALVSGDAVELQQVVVNLILNAAEAMRDQEGPRDITVRIDRGLYRRVAVEVMDSGPGLAPEIIDRIFNPFFTTKANGMGMGLQICKSIVESFGGVISAENRPEGGAIFRFELPEDVPEE